MMQEYKLIYILYEMTFISTYFSYFLQAHYKYMKATTYTEDEQKHSKG